MQTTAAPVDIAMLGTFAVWGRGTLQARALPLAQALQDQGITTAIVTTPWDMPSAAGVVESAGGVALLNTRNTRPQHAPLAVAEQLTWVRQLRPSIVHVFKPKGFGGLAARRLLGRLPVVVDSDDWEGDGGWNQQADYGFLERRLFSWQERDLQRRADAVTAASSLLQRRAVALRSAAPERVRRLPNGLPDAWRVALTDASRGPTASRRVVLYSRFAEFAADWLPRYVQELSERAKLPMELGIIGSLPRDVRSQLPVAGAVSITHHGYVARERLPELLGSGTLAVYPYRDSLITRSKQSVKLLELMAAGCPVIASDVGDVAATLGMAGLVLTGDHPAAFAAATVELLDRSERLHAMRAAGPRRVATCFTIERLADELRALYVELGLPCSS